MTKRFEKPRVLVADDSAGIRRVVRAYLETVHSCSVEEAADGLAALRRLEGPPFDLVVSDLEMPLMTGLELLAFVRRTPRIEKTAFLILTGRDDDDDDRKRAEALRVDAFLHKPFDPLSMRPYVEKHLRRQP